MTPNCPLCATYPNGVHCVEHSAAIGASTHPAVQEARELLRLEERYRLALSEEHDRNLERAVLLALDLTTCQALLRGEAVPLSRLDPYYVRRYGIKAAA